MRVQQIRTLAMCRDSDETPHPDFEHLNPDELEFENNVTQIKKSLRTIELKTPDEILNDARKLDEFQKKALHVAIEFAQNIVIARKGCGRYPSAPLMMIHGGAGSGKSTLIKTIAQYVTHILKLLSITALDTFLTLSLPFWHNGLYLNACTLFQCICNLYCLQKEDFLRPIPS